MRVVSVKKIRYDLNAKVERRGYLPGLGTNVTTTVCHPYASGDCFLARFHFPRPSPRLSIDSTDSGRPSA
jgi:hypothetical protein